MQLTATLRICTIGVELFPNTTACPSPLIKTSSGLPCALVVKWLLLPRYLINFCPPHWKKGGLWNALRPSLLPSVLPSVTLLFHQYVTHRCSNQHQIWCAYALSKLQHIFLFWKIQNGHQGNHMWRFTLWPLIWPLTSTSRSLGKSSYIFINITPSVIMYCQPIWNHTWSLIWWPLILTLTYRSRSRGKYSCIVINITPRASICITSLPYSS